MMQVATRPPARPPVSPQGGKSVEVRPVGVTKGTATARMVALMADVYGPGRTAFDMVLCIGARVGSSPAVAPVHQAGLCKPAVFCGWRSAPAALQLGFALVQATSTHGCHTMPHCNLTYLQLVNDQT
jgi:hypothetical protein